jgi:hypothetical protein
MGGGGKGGAAATGHPFKRVRWGGGPREVPRGGEEWGGAWGPARRSGCAVWPVAARQ